MALISRAGRELLDTAIMRTSSTSICRSCRHKAFRQGIRLLQQSRSASDHTLPFTEKIRRKIWGTDNPPGLKDPYGGPSFLERRRMQREAEATGGYPQGQEESSKQAAEDRPAVAQAVEEEYEYPPEPKEYVPAETWDGLEHIGHKGHWADMPPQPGDAYTPFYGRPKLTIQTKEDVMKCLQRAGLETPYNGRPTGPMDVQDALTFKIVKRFTRLAGYRIPDPVINKSKTWEVLSDAIAKDISPKPKNIAETLMMRENLADLPNLKIMGRRETPVDKEKEVGRWKVIEAELQERGLPVLGRLQS